MGVGMVFLLKVIHIMMSLSMIWCDDSLGLLCFLCVYLYILGGISLFGIYPLRCFFVKISRYVW